MDRARRWLGVAVVLLLAFAVLAHRAELGAALDEVGRLGVGWWLVFAAMLVVGVAVEGVYTSAVTPQLSIARAVLVQQSVTAANNTVVGGGPIATGVRFAMMRSWGIGDTTIGVSLVALNVVAATRLWLVALATAIAGALGADGGVLDRRVYLAVIAAAVVVLTASAVLWWVLLWHPRAALRLAARAERMWRWCRRRWARLPDLDIVGFTGRARDEARELVVLQRWRIVLATLADQAIVVARPVVVVRAFGIDAATISTWQVLIAYGLVRLAVALTPVPGGIGVTELGLAALLVRFGGPETAVVASVLTYRVLTFVLPIATGAMAFSVWRWERRRALPVRRVLAVQRADTSG